jgi:hypothetical protein
MKIATPNPDPTATCPAPLEELLDPLGAVDTVVLEDPEVVVVEVELMDRVESGRGVPLVVELMPGVVRGKTVVVLEPLELELVEETLTGPGPE